MIRRNTASQTIYLPALLLVADGAAVTSGASLQVGKDGTEAASDGTLTHVAGGVWKYTPTQAETDAAIVGLILTATNAATVVVNLVTTAANTAAAAFGANTTAPDNATISAISTEVGKIPRGTSAIAAGGNATRTKVSANGTTLVEAIT